MDVHSNQLENCVLCGRLYLKSYTDFCLDCYKEIEADFKKVDAFIKDEANREATLEELSEATEVSEKRIADFIREGRIYGEDFPNLGYPCAHCGTVIKRQVLCDSCYDQFSEEVNRTLKRDQLADEIRKPQQRAGKYWQVKQDK
ncbi:TIGR03826 family flagellar region protein [Planococcus ruber]|uniref:TIGR03826 family flagellar region protein n=1 Tax=Planococcus ruber TaxID=2027871 RepID=UPI001FEDB923|nr:TIGR03826 family flagellar region protein [Planococcus ruber]MCJ1909778.1 flagellar protein [Planococcus ruber]